MTFGDDDDKKPDDTETEDKVADVKTEKSDAGAYSATVTRESGTTGTGFGAFTEERAIDNAVSNSKK